MILTNYTHVASMHDDAEGQAHDVVEAEGTYYVREVRRGQGIGGWRAITVGGDLNPDLDTYLERCAGNFGWRVVRSSIKATPCTCGHTLGEHKGVGACRHGWAGFVPLKNVDACHCTKFRRAS